MKCCDHDINVTLLQAIKQLTADYINRVLPHMHADHKGVQRDIAERQYLQVCMLVCG